MEPKDDQTHARNYTLKKEKVVDNWIFHPDYFNDSTRFLPMSQLNLVKNRLMQSKTMPIEEANIKDINPIIESKIRAIVSAYTKKQTRARLYSQQKRQNTKTVESQESESDNSEGEDLEAITKDIKKVAFESIDDMLNDFHKKCAVKR